MGLAVNRQPVVALGLAVLQTPMSCQPDCIGQCAGDDGCGGECPADNCARTGQVCGDDGQCGRYVPQTCAGLRGVRRP